MSFESRTYDNQHGDPIVVMVVTGTHDVSRVTNLFNGASPLTEHLIWGQALRRQLNRHNAGRAALSLLKKHGGPDFTVDPAEDEAVRTAERRAVADLDYLRRAAEKVQNNMKSGCACPPQYQRECGWRDGIGEVLTLIRGRAAKLS